MELKITLMHGIPFRRKTACMAAVCILFTAALTGCSTPPKSESLTMNGMYFDTVVQIEAWGASQEIMDHCRQMCEEYEQILSATIDTSEISEINHAKGQPVTVSDETAELIVKGIEYGDLSGGLFDITIEPASSLWNFTDNPEGELPDEDALAEAVSHIDYRCIQVEGNTVTLTDPEAQIDLGGIAKGYIADRLKEYLESQGIEHALIDLGGNMLTLGGRYDGSDFRIGLQEPFADTGTVIAAVTVNDQSVVTSGDYERYFEKDGVIYHHILDPDTGYPIQNDLDQVTIISDESVDGDALSTTCFALGLEDGLELIQSLDGIEAVFVTKDGEIHTSSDEIELELME
nr:FAD:protein FMN transferase [Mediterraneibacter catenae]